MNKYKKVKIKHSYYNTIDYIGFIDCNTYEVLAIYYEGSNYLSMNIRSKDYIIVKDYFCPFYASENDLLNTFKAQL